MTRDPDLSGAAPEAVSPPKAAVDSLSLRARPPRVVRFRRGLMIGAVAVGAIGLSGLAWLALSPRTLQMTKAADEPQAADRGTPAEAVRQLPSDYAQAGAAPRLGPPLPGDLGRAVIDQQRRDGLVVGGDGADASSARPTTAQQAVEAERQRRIGQARQAREAGVMMQVASRADAAIAPDDLVGPSAAPTAPIPSAAAIRDPNGQDRKAAFMEANPRGGDIYNPHQLETPRSPYQVMAGGVIAASLITGLNSDLPGLVIAQVTENVFDSATGRFLLIPQGSRLIGSYDSVVAFGQRRALLVWQRIILPDGASLQLDNLPATDAAGYAGLADQVDFHTWRLLKGVALSTLLGVGTELSLGDDESDLVRAIRQSTQQSASQAGQQIVGKQLDVQPTLRVRPGWPLRVIVHKDLILRPWQAL
jgi:type IV secretory pathway VirB10-like protein